VQRAIDTKEIIVPPFDLMIAPAIQFAWMQANTILELGKSRHTILVA
jgi:hypothetical protein